MCSRNPLSVASRRPSRAGVPTRLARAAVAAVVALGFAAAAPRAEAGVRIVDQRVDVDGGKAAFSLRFDAVPDLYTRDALGRVADSFQYEVDADGPVGPELPVGQVESVVRGDEVFATGALRVRAAGDGVSPDPDPLAGGWGPVRAEVPFRFDGTLLTFEVPLETLRASDGEFAYRVFTAEYGLTTSEAQGVVGVGIDLPPAAWPALLTAGAWTLARVARRR